MENFIKEVEVNGVNHDITLGDNMVGHGLKKDENGVVGSDIIKITYSELKLLRDNSQLSPGSFYRITDYVTTTTQAETKSANHPFDVIVLALNENTLCEDAKAILHEDDTYFADNDLDAWELKYCLDNDKTRFEWADETNGKGVIYRMIDEKLNDCPYDFKNILFYNIKFTDYTTSDNYYYTFSHVDNGVLYDGTTEKQEKRCYGNVMGEYRIETTSILSLNRNVFRNRGFAQYGECYSNKFGDNCYNNTFGYRCRSNTFGNNCKSNTFGNDCTSNTFGNYCESNTFGNDCQYNTFGGDCSYNTLWRNCSYNTFGYNCDSNTFGNYCDSNTFGNYCDSNTFGDNCQYNTFGNNCTSNTFGNYCNSNTFKCNCSSNSFNTSCSSNSFNVSCGNNKFGNNCTSNTFGYNCNHNTFGYDCYCNTLGDDCLTNTFDPGCRHNKLSNTTGNRELVGGSEKIDISLSEEFYDDGSGQLVPTKHPDLSTQPSILPYKFMGQYIYEQLIPVNKGDRIANNEFAVETPAIISAEMFGVNSFKSINIFAAKSNALLLDTSSELDGYINVKYTDGSVLLPSTSDGYYYGSTSTSSSNNNAFDFGVMEDGTGYIYDNDILTLSKNGELTFLSIPPQYKNSSKIIIDNNVTRIGVAPFYDYLGLTSVVIGNNVTYIGGSAFMGCSSLTSVTIPDGVTKIEQSAFENCSGLTSVTIPDGVTKIEYRAFIGCSSLTSVTIPDGVTRIEQSAFENCSGLTSVVIGNSVTYIGYDAFENCTGLTSITCTAMNPPSIETGIDAPGSLTNGTFNNVSKSIPVYVPAESVEAYKSADYWKEFTNIQAINE